MKGTFGSNNYAHIHDSFTLKKTWEKNEKRTKNIAKSDGPPSEINLPTPGAFGMGRGNAVLLVESAPHFVKTR